MPSEVLLVGLAQIPHLSHLAFDIDDHSFLEPLTLLRTCVSLRVLVELYSGDEDPFGGHDDTGKFAEDPRDVAMECASFTADWQMGAHMGADYRSRAEAFIAKRMSGEIDVVFFIYILSYDVNAPPTFFSSLELTSELGNVQYKGRIYIADNWGQETGLISTGKST
ncbi:hypothetical protein C8R44DRAFT_736884 [Mycena epipterygia]|nr:hypothetical protein C8R44DRAFT_736884 [Mycena epipterygia]